MKTYPPDVVGRCSRCGEQRASVTRESGLCSRCVLEVMGSHGGAASVAPKRIKDIIPARGFLDESETPVEALQEKSNGGFLS